MKFDTLCDLILEKKTKRNYLISALKSEPPTFTASDVLKDPDDPSKGIKYGLMGKGYTTFENGEDEDENMMRLASNIAIRLNYATKRFFKIFGGDRSFSTKTYFNGLRKYLSDVMDRWGYINNKPYGSSEDASEFDEMEALVNKEAAWLGNMLLTPSRRYPNALGVFGMDTIDIEQAEDSGEPGENPKYKPDYAEIIAREFNMTVDQYIKAYEPDLVGLIKDIVNSATEKQDTPVVPPPAPKDPDDDFDYSLDDTGLGDEEEDFGINNTSEDSPLQKRGRGRPPKGNIYVHESFEDLENMAGHIDLGESGIEISDILKDPRIKGFYDAKIVKKTIKSLIEMGTLVLNADGRVELAPSDSVDWKQSMKRGGLPVDPDLDNEIKVSPGSRKTLDTDESAGIGADDSGILDPEEEMAGSDLAASRLGYRSSNRGDELDLPDTNEEDI